VKKVAVSISGFMFPFAPGFYYPTTLFFVLYSGLNTTVIASTFDPISKARKHQKIPGIPGNLPFSDCGKVCWANQVKLHAKHQPTTTGNGRHFSGSLSLFIPGQGISGLTEKNPGK